VWACVGACVYVKKLQNVGLALQDQLLFTFVFFILCHLLLIQFEIDKVSKAFMCV